MTPRSYLYVPGNRGDRLDKALRTGSDAVILDLEDAVPLSAKADARETVRAFVRQSREPDDPQLWVRVDPAHLAEDLDAAAGPRTRGVVLPKAEPDSVAELDDRLRAAEEANGLAPGCLAVIGLIETAIGVLNAPRVAAGPRVVRLGIGEADLAGELGIQPDEQRTQLWGIRTQLVLAAAAAGQARPIGPVLTAVHDHALLRQSTQTLLRQGFRARTALHPGQVAIINETFSPTPDEVARARAVLRALAEHQAQGQGAFLDESGQLVDPATVRASRDIVATADRLAATASAPGRGTPDVPPEGTMFPVNETSG